MGQNIAGAVLAVEAEIEVEGDLGNPSQGPEDTQMQVLGKHYTQVDHKLRDSIRTPEARREEHHVNRAVLGKKKPVAGKKDATVRKLIRVYKLTHTIIPHR